MAPPSMRALRVDDQPLGVDLQVRAEARALRAGAVGRVEGEEARRDLGQRRAAVGAGVVGREDLLGPVGHRQDDERRRRPASRSRSSRPGACGTPRPRQAWPRGGPRRSRSCASSACRAPAGRRGRRASPSTRARRNPSLTISAICLRYSPFLPATYGREDRRTGCPTGRRRAPVHHLLDGLGLDRPAALRAVRLADRGVEQPQVVVDLGHRADGRARVLRGRPLLDRDRRRQALDRVDVGLLHLLEELPRVGRERLDVAPLPLREDRVEGERRLARARTRR